MMRQNRFPKLAVWTLVVFSPALSSCGGRDRATPALPMLAAGDNHTVAIKTDGTLWAWGWNFRGQLGNGTNTDINTPVQVGADTGWRSVSAGREYTAAIKKDGTLWAWGRNDMGQLGDGTQESRNKPVRIGADSDWRSVTAGRLHT